VLIKPAGDPPKKPVKDYMDRMHANNKLPKKPDNDQLFDMSNVNYINGVSQNTTESGQY
jgi:hypothetical protein